MSDQSDGRQQSEPLTLEQLNLPGDAALYVAGGVPLLFHRVSLVAPAGAEEWLYLPDPVLEEIAAELGPSGMTGPSVGTGITADDNIVLYPLAVGGAVRAVYGTFSADSGNADHNIPRAVLDWLVRQELERSTQTRTQQLDLTLTLVSCDNTTERMVRSALNLMIAEVPSGLAATYGEVDGIYRLQTAIGNIAMWDMLEGDLPHSVAGRWEDSVNRGRYYHPAGFLPERPLLLDTAPDFLFVHEGLQSDRSRSFIAMPIPGSISRLAGERLHAIAQFIGNLHEQRFGAGEDILNICTSFSAACREKSSFDKLLYQVFEILNRRIGLSRLAVSDRAGRGWSVRKRAHAEPMIRKESSSPIGGNIRLGPGPGRLFVTNVFAHGLLSDEEAKRYYLDNVKSELAFRFSDLDESTACIAFGSPASGPNLKRFEKILETAGMILHLYFRASRPNGELQADVISAEGPLSSPRSRRRLQTAATLTEGHFHTVFDSLAWLLGQSEVLAATGCKGESMATLPTGTCLPGLRTALDRVVRHLEQVRRILSEAPALPTATIPATRLIAELPAMLEGHRHFIQDTKNIAVRIVAHRQAIRPFDLPTVDVYDSLYPVLVALLNEAICSGEVRISASQQNGIDVLGIECPHSLIEHTSLREILQQITGRAAESLPDSDQFRIPSGESYQWVCDPDAHSQQRAWLMRSDAVPKRPTSPRRVTPPTEVR